MAPLGDVAMHALAFILPGAGLGFLIGQFRSRWTRNVLIVLAGLLGLVGVLITNAALAELWNGTLGGNPLMGGGVYLLALWYFQTLPRRRDAAKVSLLQQGNCRSM